MQGPNSYAPFTKAEVSEGDEASATNGPGIRINADHDNGSAQVQDRNISGSLIPNENDLIEIRIDAVPGMTNLVLEVGSDDLLLFPSHQKGDPIFVDEMTQRTDPLTFTNNTTSVFVEWASLSHGTADLKLVDASTNGTIDTLKFHTFSSITIVLGGLNQVPSVPTDPNHGVFLIADTIYREGYDVMKFDEEDVRPEGTSGNRGDGPAYREIENAVNNRMVADVSIIGYSQGGGSAYNLSRWLDDRRSSGAIAPFSLVFTAYVDAIRDNDALARPEDRLPAGTQWHLNLFQTIDDVLDGSSVPGANENIDVEESVLFPFDEISHTDIDDAIEVIEWVLMRYRQNVER